MTDVTAERWAWIPGLEGRYLVSDRGNVLSLARSRPGLLAGTVKGRPGGAQYRYVRPGERSYRVHRLVMLAFVGPCPEGLEVCHKNGDSLDNRLVNLYYGSRSQNALDMVRHGSHHNARKDVCGKCGGAFDYRGRDGGRKCRACHAAYGRARRAARKAA
jgi:hypothetical protein